MTTNVEVKADENFPITAQGYTKGKLIDDTECEILVDTGASKSYMSTRSPVFHTDMAATNFFADNLCFLLLFLC